MIKIGSIGEEIWISTTYKKLPKFCYSCYKLDHVLKECKDYKPDSKEEFLFGERSREFIFTKGFTKGKIVEKFIGFGWDRGRGRSDGK